MARYSSRVSSTDVPLLSPPADVRAEVEVDVPLVRRLLQAQHPDLADEPVRRFAEGWDNALFRVGERWLARLPRRAIAAPLVAQEARWLPVLAPRLPLQVPVPKRVGTPADGYPWNWTLCEWLDGTPAAGVELDAFAAATALGEFLRVLHGLDAPDDAPTSDVRGVSPRARSVFLQERLRRDPLRGLLDVDRLERVFSELAAAPDWRGPPVWCHGDLHPFNLLVQGGQLVAVLDWGDLHRREPAPDLAAPWMLLPTSFHAAFRAAYGPIDDDTWRRGKAWALYFGVMLFDAGLQGAGDAATRVGRATLERVLSA
jgi:aminoglycoside phosphotransferase (APT) family kinase protein